VTRVRIVVSHEREKPENVKAERASEKVRGREGERERSRTIYIYIYIYIYCYMERVSF
jgi:hypothetical protein